MLTFQSLPVEQQRLMTTIVRRLSDVETMIEDRNYGRAAEELAEIKQYYLPVDTGPYWAWPALERVTS